MVAKLMGAEMAQPNKETMIVLLPSSSRQNHPTSSSVLIIEKFLISLPCFWVSLMMKKVRVPDVPQNMSFSKVFMFVVVLVKPCAYDPTSPKKNESTGPLIVRGDRLRGFFVILYCCVSRALCVLMLFNQAPARPNSPPLFGDPKS